MKILVTGFEPFGGEPINPSWEAVRHLPDTISGAEIIKVEIPVVFGRSADVVHEAIVEHVRAARTAGRDWYVFDLAGVLDGLAQRRYADDDQAAQANGWKPYPLPPTFAGLDTRFFKSDPTGRRQGGLFGLDGVHPTTSGYAILAGAILDVLRTAGLNPAPLDYPALARQDTLNASPPALMSVAWDLITPFLTRLVTRRSS